MPGPPLLSDLQPPPTRGGDLTAVKPPEGKPRRLWRRHGLALPDWASPHEPPRVQGGDVRLPRLSPSAGSVQGCQLASGTPWTKV